MMISANTRTADIVYRIYQVVSFIVTWFWRGIGAAFFVALWWMIAKYGVYLGAYLGQNSWLYQ